jgi:acetolactate synthase-1/2/3 large subunit
MLVAGQVNHDRVHEQCGRYHELDLEGIFRPCTRFAATVMGNDQIPGMVDRAFTEMVAGRPGPSALVLPQDLMAMPADAHGSISPAKLARVAPDDATVERARELLLQSQRPIILAGGGAVSSDAGIEIVQLATRLECPVITTLNGKGIVDERLAFSLGHGRSRRARLALSRADVMLAIGCRFTEVFTSSGSMPVPETLVQIDIDPAQIGVNYAVALGITGDARTTLRAILSALPGRRTEWKGVWQRARHAEQLKPEWLIRTLREEIPEDAIVFADACEIGLKMHTDFLAFSARSFFYPSTFAALGWGFPAALGGAVGRPDRRIVSINGDGGFLISAQELATAVRYQLDVIIVIHNDSTYGAVKAIQRAKHGARYRDCDLNNPDFVKLGESFGVPSCRARDAAEFSSALRAALERQGPSLVEVPDTWRSLRVA